jgi:hypothetical protein
VHFYDFHFFTGRGGGGADESQCKVGAK